jgi:hypothetical protein
LGGSFLRFFLGSSTNHGFWRSQRVSKHT